ncbi:MAG: hypothetical protein ABI772_12265, partial [Bacteroidota bacterium]
MKKFLIIVLFLFIADESDAQFVTIPDTNFVNWLNNNGFSSCMNGNQMDTTCSQIITAVNLLISNTNIQDLTGIKYFKNLLFLYCYYNQLTFLPELPSLLKMLRCNNNQITSVYNLPD